MFLADLIGDSVILESYYALFIGFGATSYDVVAGTGMSNFGIDAVLRVLFSGFLRGSGAFFEKPRRELTD